MFALDRHVALRTLKGGYHSEVVCILFSFYDFALHLLAFVFLFDLVFFFDFDISF
jgi:hypothetical protein